MSSFDTWADRASNPPRCPDCGCLLRSGSVHAPGAGERDCPMCPALIPCWKCGDYYPDQIEPCTHGRQLCGTCVDACAECLMEKL